MTPADIAARAAAVAAEWTPERVSDVRSIRVLDPWSDDMLGDVPWLAQVLDAIEALLADRERLRGLVAEAHSDGNALMEIDHEGNRWYVWACQVCPASGATERADEAAACRAAHVAAILDGGGA